MPLSDPRVYPNRQSFWIDYIRNRRLSQLTPLLTEALLKELAANPNGLHGDQSEALSQVLNFVRNQTPMQGRAFVFVDALNQTYQVARLRGRGAPPTLDGPTFSTEAEAVAAVIVERLRTLGMWHGADIVP